MEGGLPERFREEQELERQRDVHDDLISRGLSIITDSYLDQVERVCQEAAVPFTRRSLEGKNYRQLVKEANCGDYDLLVLGALGVGAIEGSRLGTVCQRVARRAAIDTLVIKDPQRAVAHGPIVVAVDGSRRAYGGLLTALSLASSWHVPVKVVAAFDPYYHYVAFNRIAGVISEEAGKVFRFKEQEKLHEEIIDSGLAQIYEGHLLVAESIAAEYGMEVETELLDGKPHDAIEKYLRKVQPSLLVIGKLGIHADAELDIGGNAENLLRNVDCAVLLSQQEHQPRVDQVAEATTSWTKEAQERMRKIPSFVRDMARMAILRYAEERGHTVITERIVEEATARLCPSRAEQAMTEIVAAHDHTRASPQGQENEPLLWSHVATLRLQSVADHAVRENLRMRAEKKARQEGMCTVAVEHIEAFVSESPNRDEDPVPTLHWQSAALARLARVPEGFMRDLSREYIEDYAREQHISEVALEIAEAGLERARADMTHATPAITAGACPSGRSIRAAWAAPDSSITWSPAAEERVQKVPAGFMRDLTRRRVETFARRKGKTEITPRLIEEKYAEWAAGSEKQRMELPWTTESVERINRIPKFVRGMVIKEVEQCARELNMDTVTPAVVAQACSTWARKDSFHSETNPGQYVGRQS
jgi:nucleotide-binding universal stress UspA family protein